MAPLTAAKANLQRLAVMRLAIVCALLIALLYAAGWLRASLAWAPLLLVVALLATAAIFTFWRLGQSWPVTDAELFTQLLFDVLVLSILLYFSGGATNPFVSWYLVPLAITAVVLPRGYCVALALICLGLYTGLLFLYQPLPLFEPVAAHAHHHGMGDAAPNLHVIGMWFNFALSAALITYVVVRMASALREQEAELRRRREQALHQEQLLAVATLAAGTAHELSTPLSTMTVLLDEMQSSDPQLNEDIALLRQQVGSCRATLKQLVETARQHQQPQSTAIPATDALAQVLDRWQLLRPQAQFTLEVKGAMQATVDVEPPLLALDAALQQAIINLLDNGMDAGGPLMLTLAWQHDSIELRIRDRGPGLPLELAEQLGTPFVTTKGKGLGLGLYLSHATAERCGGSVHLYNHPQGGTEAVLRLPAVREA
jgi:two-component system sensor histidine kinase RegB